MKILNREKMSAGICFVLLAFGALFLLGMSFPIRPPENINVLIMQASRPVELCSNEICAVKTQNGLLAFTIRAGSKFEVGIYKDDILINNKRYKGDYLTITSSGLIDVGGRKLKGIIKLRKTVKDNRTCLLVINRLDIEDYIKGVVPNEVYPEWDMEALKAQAVAARSYAFYHVINNEGTPYDLSSVSQNYAGAGTETPRTNSAVDATRGEILIYKGKPLCSFFSTVCGGCTEIPENVWVKFKDNFPKGVKCRHCRNAPDYKWQAVLSMSEIESKLRSAGFKLGTLKSIRPSKRSKYGKRITELMLTHSSGRLNVGINDFRIALGSKRVKSGLFKLKKRGKRVYFGGKGHGHGVGMCQYGALTLAKKGYNYKKILKYYYPGAKIEKNRI